MDAIFTIKIITDAAPNGIELVNILADGGYALPGHWADVRLIVEGAIAAGARRIEFDAGGEDGPAFAYDVTPEEPYFAEIDEVDALIEDMLG